MPSATPRPPARPDDVPGVRPDDPPARAAARLLAFQARRVERCLADLQRNPSDPDAVHDLRVATRRARAILSVFRRHLPGRPARDLRRRLRDATRRLGPCRDLDVLVAALGGPGGEPPAGAAARAHFEALRDRARRRLSRWLAGPAPADLLRHLARAAEAGEAAAAGDVATGNGRDRVALAAPVLLFDALRRARACAPEDRPDPADLHGLRIRLKRLRYAAECFREVLGPAGEAFVAAVRDLQDVLGAMQDARVAADRVEAYLRDGPAPGTPGARAAETRAAAAWARRRRREAATAARGFPARWRAFERSRVRVRLAQAAARL